MSQRVGGIIQLQVNGEVYKAKGAFSYNPGVPQREAVIGSDAPHGFKETPKVAFIEGEITDMPGLKLKDLFSITNATVTLKLGIGKMFALNGAYYAGDGNANTDEGNITVRFEGRAKETA